MSLVCVQILLKPRAPPPNDDTFSTLWFLFGKAANPQLVLTNVTAGELTDFFQSKVNLTEAIWEAASSA
jgi:hypothetical protein